MKESKPTKVLIPKAYQDASNLAAMIEERGGVVDCFPVLKIEDFDMSPLNEWLVHDWIVFTSVHAIASVKRQIGLEWLCDKKVACVGNKTAMWLRSEGIAPVLVPERYSSQSLGEKLLVQVTVNESLLHFCSSLSEDRFIQTLRSHGLNAVQMVVYQNHANEAIRPDLQRSLESQMWDIALFTSPSTFEYTLHLTNTTPEAWKQVQCFCIGPATAKALKNKGIVPKGIASEHTLEGLQETLSSAQVL
ncbi:uroporphyrinogen-III synthase [Aureibacillus halotolerans]|uniref:Uroporphyrinogen-III synthase n=1 Tax=Aureibacillus halotolerans TaxID=1508390 RepID=A0A4R6U0X7_9BACI|nr:uroporphyrinogen-III synthase [Aureibacillus halotolerans]TDQ37945.1 uroporphyrinogen-III synthase [Aureibacillus halotolerans]